MKKIFFLLALIVLFLVPGVQADRNTATTTIYKTSQLIQRGEGLVYSVSFVATANGGDFILYDATDVDFTLAAEILSSIRAEGSEVTALGSHYQDFSDKPLEFGTGIYLVINDGYVVLRYE